jgi:nucleotide-binding universal stress UspA family protein
MSHHLLILDGSKAAEAAIPFALAAARTFGADLHVLHVLEAAAPSPQGAVDSVAWRMQRAEALAYLEGWRTRIEEPGLAVTTEVREGRPAEQALDVARSRKVDLLVLTPRGAGAGTGVGLGDTAQKVIGGGTVSFLLVRRAPGMGEAEAAQRFRRVLVPLDASRRAMRSPGGRGDRPIARGLTAVTRRAGAQAPDAMLPTPDDIGRERVARNKERGDAPAGRSTCACRRPTSTTRASSWPPTSVARSVGRSRRRRGPGGGQRARRNRGAGLRPVRQRRAGSHREDRDPVDHQDLPCPATRGGSRHGRDVHSPAPGTAAARAWAGGPRRARRPRGCDADGGVMVESLLEAPPDPPGVRAAGARPWRRRAAAAGRAPRLAAGGRRRGVNGRCAPSADQGPAARSAVAGGCSTTPVIRETRQHSPDLPRVHPRAPAGGPRGRAPTRGPARDGGRLRQRGSTPRS